MEGQFEAVLNFSFPLNIFVELLNPRWPGVLSKGQSWSRSPHSHWY